MSDDVLYRIKNADPFEHRDNFELLKDARDEIERLQARIESAKEAYYFGPYPGGDTQRANAMLVSLNTGKR